MKKQTLEDKQLVDAARTDLANFKLLYKKYMKAVYRYTYKRLGYNRELAEDITSETFTKAIEKFDQYVYRKKPFVVWLYTIAHNLIVDHFRKSKNKNISLDSLEIPPADEKESVIDTLSREEIKDKIKEKSSMLPDDLNNIFTLRHTEDLTFREIGSLLGKSEGAVKMQYYRGLEALKSLLEKE